MSLPLKSYVFILRRELATGCRHLEIPTPNCAHGYRPLTSRECDIARRPNTQRWSPPGDPRISPLMLPQTPTYDHTHRRIRDPVCSPIDKPVRARLVVGSVTTSESLVLYVFLPLFASSQARKKQRGRSSGKKNNGQDSMSPPFFGHRCRTHRTQIMYVEGGYIA